MLLTPKIDYNKKILEPNASATIIAELLVYDFKAFLLLFKDSI